jgi:undecaprenyl-diphosphatase
MTSLVELLQSLDRWALYAINHGLSNSVFDAVMPRITAASFWMPVYVVGIVGLVVQGVRTRLQHGHRLIVCAMVMLLGIVVLDQAGNRLLKEPIARPRPYEVLPDIHQLVGSGGGSFPSNHALNNAFIAVILSAWFPRWRKAWWGIAAVIMFSRPYCGVHYPSDVLGGLLIGVTAGVLIVGVVRSQWPQYLTVPPPQS